MDRQEFEYKYEKVKDRLFTFLVQLAGDAEEAGEILQEAVYRAYRRRKSFQARSSFSTWVYSIAMNVWKNEKRKNSRSLPLEESGAGYLETHNPTPEDQAATREKGRKIKAGLERLSESYRTPFLLKHLEGFSYKEISQLMGIGEEAARVRVYRARHALRAMLKETEI
jgi:RNA polymerase sigma-70 factor (ECF subfamily)